MPVRRRRHSVRSMRAHIIGVSVKRNQQPDQHRDGRGDAELVEESPRDA